MALLGGRPHADAGVLEAVQKSRLDADKPSTIAGIAWPRKRRSNAFALPSYRPLTLGCAARTLLPVRSEQ
jgi:hypothetical protein